jgi:hypothetical protein
MLEWKAAESADDGGLEHQVSTLKAILSPPSQVDDLLSLGLGPTAISVFISVAIGIYSGESPDEVLDRLKSALAEGAESEDSDGKKE